MPETKETLITCLEEQYTSQIAFKQGKSKRHPERNKEQTKHYVYRSFSSCCSINNQKLNTCKEVCEIHSST